MVLCKGEGPLQKSQKRTLPSPTRGLACLIPPAAHLPSQPAVLLHMASLAGDQSGYCCHNPGPPSGEGAVTTVTICPAGSQPACLIHLDKCSLRPQAQILGSKGFYSGGR